MTILTLINTTNLIIEFYLFYLNPTAVHLQGAARVENMDWIAPLLAVNSMGKLANVDQKGTFKRKKTKQKGWRVLLT